MNEFFSYLKKMDLKAIFLTPTTNGFLQFFRYAFVGGIATVVDWAIQYIATEAGLHYLLSGILSFLGGLAVNFLLSKRLVFKASQARVGTTAEFLGYAVIGAIGLGLTLLIMYFFTDILHLHYMLSKVIATLLVLFWNYIARKKLLYR